MIRQRRNTFSLACCCFVASTCSCSLVILQPALQAAVLEYTRKLTVPQFGKQDIRFAYVTTLLCLSLTLRNEAVGSKLVE